MDKQQPASVILIEPSKDGWRVTARDTCRRGFERGPMPIIAVCPSIAEARTVLRQVKGVAP